VEALNDAFANDVTIADEVIAPTMIATSSANVIVRTLIPENPCASCGGENRSSSRFCRHCGHSLDETSPLVTEVCQVGYSSDTGQRANDNEDMLLVVQGLCVTLAPPPRPFSLFAVADGLRGAQGKSASGHEASRLAIETVADVLLPLIATTPQAGLSWPTPGSSNPLQTANRPSGRTSQKKPPAETILEQWLRDAVRQANQVIYHCNADYDTTMASTLTVGVMYKRRCFIANVGDSRAYHYRASRGTLQRITPDSTQAQQYRYLGQTATIAVDLFQVNVEPDDLILLCTDGLWHMVRDERLKELLTLGGDPQRLTGILVEEANRAGGEGNVSTIIVRVQ
jgi:serine/threonine protein phosphatase PrpC